MRLCTLTLIAAVFGTPVLAQDDPVDDGPVDEGVDEGVDDGFDDGLDEDLGEFDFTDLDIEELMQVKVTSTEGRPMLLADTPAAIFVLTGEDIRRTGVRSIPEALRQVPGITVGQIAPSIWAISSRGFTDRFANKLLVLVDGRTVYSPLFSGTFWNTQDILMEDLDRIEVIRGPGATLWGANAMNGVVSVTTRSARETQGLFLQGGGGNYAQGFGAVRYGGAIDDDLHYRVWGQYENFDDFEDVSGNSTNTDWDKFDGGFRMDGGAAGDLQFTVEAGGYLTPRIGEGVRVAVPGVFTFQNVALSENYSGAHVLGRVSQVESDNRGWSAQAYWDYAEVVGGQPGFGWRQNTVDLDYRQYLPLGERDEHVLMWGAGYQHWQDSSDAGPTLGLTPRSDGFNRFGAFIQDTWTIIEDRLDLMIGSKFEHNSYTGFEFQPSGRLSWKPDRNQTVWGAISRAVRTPSRFADAGFAVAAYANPATPLSFTGNTNLDSETVIAYEAGYRVRPADRITVDIAGFYNDYDDLITIPPPTPGGSPFLNAGRASTYGVEVSSTWKVTDGWELSGSYSFIQIDVDTVAGSDVEGKTPQNQANLRSYLDITEDLEFNSVLYYVDNVPGVGASAYLRLDLGLTWRPTPNVELAIWGQNLLDDSHFEFRDDLFQSASLEVPRGVYAQVSLRF